MDEIKDSPASFQKTFSICVCTALLTEKAHWQNYAPNPFILSVRERNYWVGSLLLSLLRKPLEISLAEILFPSVSLKNVGEEFSFISNITQQRYDTNN